MMGVCSQEQSLRVSQMRTPQAPAGVSVRYPTVPAERPAVIARETVQFLRLCFWGAREQLGALSGDHCGGSGGARCWWQSQEPAAPLGAQTQKAWGPF